MTCHARALGAQRRPDVSSPGFSALCFNGCPHTLVSSNPPPCHSAGWSATLALRVSLPLCPSLSPLPSLSVSLSFSVALLQLRPTLSLFRIKGFSGCSVGLYSPLGSNPPPQDRRGAVYPLSYDELFSALLFRRVLLPPTYRSPSGISPFAWGCAQQRVEEPHSISGYRVRLPEERSLQEPSEVSSARHPRGGGGVQKNNSRKNFPHPKIGDLLNSTPRVWVWKVQGGYFSR